MATTEAPLAVTAAAAAAFNRPARSLWADTWFHFRRHRLAMAGVIILTLIVLGVIVGPLLWTVPIDVYDFAERMKGPSLAHPFGTDDNGRDLLARIIFGGKISLAVGVAAVALAISLGTFVGSLAGYFGRLDNPLMRVTDLFLSLPVLPFLLVITFLFRQGIESTLGLELGAFVVIVTVIAGLTWMPVARLVRASFLSLKQKEFVEAARAVGDPDMRIIVRHILPNVLSPVLVAATIGVGGAIITESTLSFLGLGFPPDFPTWGRVLFEAKDDLDLAPHWALFPGLAIFLTVLSINFIGDGLRDALDPRRVS